MPTSPSDKKFEKHIVHLLNLSEFDCKYIYITKDAISFSFPIKLKLEIWVDNKKLSLDKEALYGIFESISDFFRYELSKGEFKDVLVYSTDPSERQEIKFFIDICNNDEAIEAVKWLIKFKKRFEF